MDLAAIVTMCLFRVDIWLEGDTRYSSVYFMFHLSISLIACRKSLIAFSCVIFRACSPECFSGSQSFRAISTARLNMSPCLHLQPIDVVVFHDPYRKPNLEVGFALRCFQRLSRPSAATRQCGWRHNRLTGGWSVPVLSY